MLLDFIIICCSRRFRYGDIVICSFRNDCGVVFLFNFIGSFWPDAVWIWVIFKVKIVVIQWISTLKSRIFKLRISIFLENFKFIAEFLTILTEAIILFKFGRKRWKCSLLGLLSLKDQIFLFWTKFFRLCRLIWIKMIIYISMMALKLMKRMDMILSNFF